MRLKTMKMRLEMKNNYKDTTLIDLGQDMATDMLKYYMQPQGKNQK